MPSVNFPEGQRAIATYQMCKAKMALAAAPASYREMLYHEAQRVNLDSIDPRKIPHDAEAWDHILLLQTAICTIYTIANSEHWHRDPTAQERDELFHSIVRGDFL